jgi:hypothetical protein
MEEKRRAVREAMAGVSATVAPDRGEGLIAAMRRALPPDLVVEGEDAEDVGFIHRRVDGQAVYFVANMGAKARRAWLNLPRCDGVRLYDPMEMQDAVPLSLAHCDGRTRLEVALAPNQSLVLVAGEAGLPPRPAEGFRAVLRVTGWTVSVEGEPVAKGLTDPVSWERFERRVISAAKGAMRRLLRCARAANTGWNWSALTAAATCCWTAGASFRFGRRRIARRWGM